MDHLANMRRDYARHPDDSLAAADPIALMRVWLDDAANTEGIDEPNAMALATCSASGIPSARMVLVKGFDHISGGIAFYTGLGSRKAMEVAANGRAAGTMWWGVLHRQLRLVGDVVPIDREQVNAYFRSRPIGSQASARASRQSSPTVGPEVFRAQLAAITAEHSDEDAPDHWGGFWLVPHEIEFWHGRSDRAHDRVVFARPGSPAAQRLAEAAREAGNSAALETVLDGQWVRTWLQP
jgi:pyridoxamine 5'-phosphate oxidase